MSRISGGAVWSNCPRTDLARAPAEKLAGATLLSALFSMNRDYRLKFELTFYGYEL